ncbi:RDD family protein [Streptomyces sp. NPDC026206]|uniref:RDD family protein n=1 Tax=Streptomyces sp. NPDC026206 TaxID=3157089 RepID=UPI0034112CCE
MSHYQQQPGAQNPYGYSAPPPQYYPPSMPPMGPAGPPEQALANQGARLGARVLDLFFMIVPMIVVGIINAIVVDASGVSPAGAALLGLVGLAVVLCYEPVMNSKYGATFGKRICGLRVARLSDGQNLSLGAAFGRWAVYILIGFIPLGGLINVLSCCWDKPYRQCFHDKAAGSVVVNRNA